MRFLSLFVCCALLLGACATLKVDTPLVECPATLIDSSSDKAYTKIQALLDEIVTLGVPGIAMATYSKGQWWESAAGFASVEKKIPMGSCHLHYLQSISKTYMAVAVLQLYEKGQLDIDASIGQYLPPAILEDLPEYKGLTVKMLLNHTSGLPEYNDDPNYISTLLQRWEYHFEPEEYIEVIQNKAMDFEPGSHFSYRNLNYVLLALMVDELVGSHTDYISQNIFQPLGLQSSYYQSESGYLQYPELYNAYWDRHADGYIENISQLQRKNVSEMVGDDGIVATPRDAVLFLKGIFENQLLQAETLQLMQEWATYADGGIAYGLGLDYAKFVDQLAYGHSGGGIGAGCQLYYFPKQEVYCFIGINLGTVTESPIHQKIEPKLNELYQALLAMD